MGNPVVHFEVGCLDREKTTEFYSALFGWAIHDFGPGSAISTGAEKGIAGHITSPGHEPHHYTIFYVEVVVIEAALAKVEALGGKKIVGPIPIPTGSFAWFSDLDGNTVGLIQPRS